MSIITELLNLIFPRYCPACGNKLLSKEREVCVSCYFSFKRYNFKDSFCNKATALLCGSFPLERATALYVYEKDSKVQKAVHTFKYHNNRKLAYELGLWSVDEINDNDSGFFNSGIDYIVPIPLHPSKKRKRGYNQSELIAKGISEATGLPVMNDFVRRKVATETQTRKNYKERLESMKGAFDINESIDMRGKHLLLIDDVITTGGTITECAKAICRQENIRISVLGISMVKREKFNAI